MFVKHLSGDMKSFLLSALLSVTLGFVSGCAKPSSPESPTKSDSAAAEKTKQPPTEAKQMSTNEVAVIKPALGEMVVEFWPDVAPKTVENFKKLAKQGFYDGTAFHRIMTGFMIQGGDPLTKDPSAEARWGTGDPGYKIKAEFNKKPHDRGVLSMARSSDPDSA